MSSTPNKRSNGEGGTGGGGHAHLSAKYQNEDSASCPGSGAKMTSVSSDAHVPYEAGQDSRLPRFPRTESRDADRRLTLLPVFRMCSSSNPSNPDHLVGPERRSDSRDSKDFNRDSKFEHRESRVESRDLYQGSKAADVKFENRVEDSKDSRDGCFEHKGDLRTDKDPYAGAASHSSWKDLNEQLREKHYSDASNGNIDPWHPSISNLHVSVEGEKDTSHIQKDYIEAREAVGENKVDVRGDDKFKDKDRKRKEAKHREWGEGDKDKNDRRWDKDKSDRRYDGDNKDIIKDERETEGWEKERKDLSKGKEKTKDRDKDYVKREAGIGAEKGSFLCDKDLPDIPGRGAQLGNSVTEIKKFKDGDGWRIGDKDPGDRKKDRYIDAEGERIDKRNGHHDKKSDEGGADAEGSAEKGSQQRKKTLRPRGSPQHTNHDHAFMSRTHGNEGSQGKADISTIMYKVGECMQDLIKLWKEYESSQADRMSDVSLSGPTLDIRIPAEHVSATNRQVRGGQLWGTDVYTDDSDLVAVLMHTGYCRPTASPPPATIQELRATIRVLPPQDSYISTLRNNVRSRAWGSGIGCSYRVERCCIVKKEGGTINLEPCLTHSSTLEPTLAPVAVERTMTTRAAASNALRQQRFVREVTIQFNLCCEPWLKYSISVVADKGLKKANYTSSRLKKGEVLYLETHSRRYELCFNGEKMVKTSTLSLSHEAELDKSHNCSQNTNGERAAVECENAATDVFRWSQCKKPLPQRMMKTIGIPLPAEHVKVLEDNLEWEDIRWSSTGVLINGKEYALARAHFLSLH